MLTPPVETRGFLTFFTAFILFAGCLGGGGWGDVNVPWKRYVTYAGVGVGEGGGLTSPPDIRPFGGYDFRPLGPLSYVE